jgi:hypothetical protein
VRVGGVKDASERSFVACFLGRGHLSSLGSVILRVVGYVAGAEPGDPAVRPVSVLEDTDIALRASWSRYAAGCAPCQPGSRRGERVHGWSASLGERLLSSRNHGRCTCGSPDSDQRGYRLRNPHPIARDRSVAPAHTPGERAASGQQATVGVGDRMSLPASNRRRGGLSPAAASARRSGRPNPDRGIRGGLAEAPSDEAGGVVVVALSAAPSGRRRLVRRVILAAVVSSDPSKRLAGVWFVAAHFVFLDSSVRQAIRTDPRPTYGSRLSHRRRTA